MKYQDFYTTYNGGKSANSRKRNRRLGKRKMRIKLEKEMKKMMCEDDGMEYMLVLETSS